MSQNICIINRKGGVGKTTTALCLAQGLMMSGKSVLAVDLDPQCNMSTVLGATFGGRNVLGVLLKQCTAEEAIQMPGNVHLLPACIELSALESSLKAMGREYRLKEALEVVEGKYDYVVIDTPPAYGVAQMNALTAAHKVVIPANADVFNLESLADTFEAIKQARQYTNRGLIIGGVLLTRYAGKQVLASSIAQQMQDMAAKEGASLYGVKIRENVALRECQAVRKSIWEYAPTCNAARDYDQFVKEVTE